MTEGNADLAVYGPRLAAEVSSVLLKVLYMTPRSTKGKDNSAIFNTPNIVSDTGR